MTDTQGSIARMVKGNTWPEMYNSVGLWIIYNEEDGWQVKIGIDHYILSHSLRIFSHQQRVQIPT